ncbi:hypothetical protein RVBP17_1350 [Pseudomonas phage sp. 30-3]|uniref:Uncharacterized protein n=1 Tax=Pseudomonas phage vB_PaeM_PA5oct TaxID=2163605 RepID=A0A4Y1LUT3_9CAUD|nr:virion structural protein [Pseudomonas phage vB_PaeM_PA5oct]WMI31769.1 hypothetical protein GBBBJNDB_00066 [Pseudomonas phage Callisto]WPK38698.1 virion structural protein [Pseudomonas phage Cassandra]WPK39219.1 virion structural protein [Pseudomonas phage Deifobo]WPK39731.1 virion structural protein [Pseudomonas phage Ettore]WPK40252.1 virion structural protein [Pseudomonas phage Paride]VOH53857.1 hypothetical protein MIJ3_00066 [Pseudomonas phage vB_PaeM_MIJ3]BDR25822.1 hypothetical pro
MSTRRSILEELNNYVPSKSKEELIEYRAEHIIQSAIHLIEYIESNYSDADAEQLEKKLLSSIKYKDAKRFSKSVRKLKE